MQTISTTTPPNCTIAVGLSDPKAIVTKRLRASWIELDELRSRKSEWDSLSNSACYRNPSFESNYLLPALNHLGSDTVRVMVVEQFAANESRLVGLVPFETKRIYRLPFKAAEIWKHDQCFDTTPLLEESVAADAWKVVCQTLIRDGYSLISLDTVSAEPQFESVLRQVEQSDNVFRFQRDHFQRAAFTPAETPEKYSKSHVSKSILKNTRRLMRRLEELGTVTWHQSNERSDYEQLANEFLRIEASGWKGEEGTALASNESTRAFYKELVLESTTQGKARFLSLNLDGRPIAMLSDIQSGASVYSYKTAYDDAYAQYSPGQQVEVKNIDLLHQDGIQFADSCTASGNSTINRIWGQKVAFQNLVLSLTPGVARTAVKALPMIQSAVHRLRKN